MNNDWFNIGSKVIITFEFDTLTRSKVKRRIEMLRILSFQFDLESERKSVVLFLIIRKFFLFEYAFENFSFFDYVFENFSF